MKKKSVSLAGGIIQALKLKKPCKIAVHSESLASLALRSCKSLATVYGGDETLLTFIIIPKEKQENCPSGTILE